MEQDQKQNNPIQSNADVMPASKQSYLPWIISIVLLAAVVFLGFFFLQVQEEKKNLAAEMSDLQAFKKNIEDQEKSKEDMNAKNTSILKVITPKGGDVLCLDQSNEISWQAPQNLQTVVASLDTSVTFNRLGEFPAILKTENGVGLGSVQWNMKNEGGYEVAPSDVYKITLSGTLDGQRVSATSDGIFSVKKCDEQGNPTESDSQTSASICTKENSCKFRTAGSAFRCDANLQYSESGNNWCGCDIDCEVVKK